MNKIHCQGCHNNFYNGDNPLGVRECWSYRRAKLVLRIPIGHWERPPYKNKKKTRVPDCWYGRGPNRIHYIDPNTLDKDGYWK